MVVVSRTAVTTTTRTKPSPAKSTAVAPFLQCLSLSALLTLLLLLGRDRSSDETLDADAVASFFSRSSTAPLPLRGVVLSGVAGNGSSGGGYSPSSELWRQPEGEGYRPCLDFGIGYRKASAKIAGEKRRFLVVVVSGGLNQQRNQIADAVVIARILEAAIVVPVLQVNLVWGDESEFSEIFDVEHFKKTLESDVRVVSAIPATHFSGRHKIESKIPRDVSPKWIHSRFFNQLTQDGLIVLKGLDSKLTKNLPPDLQKLKCKVAFQALRFAEPIREVGEKIAKRMWIEGPYMALHLRLEKDVWVRTGCRTGLGPKFDDIIAQARQSQPDLLTGTLNMTYAQRRLAGLCPLNASEIARLLRALGAERKTRIYIAGGESFGGEKAMAALTSAFPNMARKENLARDDELSAFSGKPSAMAAIDYTVSLSSDVFVPSHGGNMGRALMGHRAFVGHRKSVKPNKRLMISLLEDHSVPEARLQDLLREIHTNSTGRPEPRGFRRDRDVIAHPVPECMCKRPRNTFFF